MRKRILPGLAACFLLSLALPGCQTAHRASHNTKVATDNSAGKQGAPNSKQNDVHGTRYTGQKYYYTNKKYGKVAPKPNIQPAKPAQPVIEAQVAAVAVQPVTVVSTAIAAPPETAMAAKEQLTTENTNKVTVFIKDSIEPVNTIIAAVTKLDTVLVNEMHKEAVVDTSVAATEQPIALTPEEMDTVLARYAEMISIDRSEINNFNLYFFIDDWYGTDYKWGGTDSSGIDCSAFSQKLYSKVYDVDILRTAKQQHKHCERVKYPNDVNEGDLVFFRVHRLRISHVGVYLANGYFVHASSSNGVVISNLNNKYWHKRFAGCGRIPHEERSITESDYVQ